MNASNIERALNILNHRDWYYMMADYGYDRRRENAKAEMKEYVALCNGVEDTNIKNALRALWILKYNECRDNINGCCDDEKYASEKAKLMKVICS